MNGTNNVKPTIAAILAVVILAGGGYYTTSAAEANPTFGVSALALFSEHINHVIFVVLENHAYDSEFGSYCLTLGVVCPHVADGIPAGTCVPENPMTGPVPCVTPYNFTRAQWTVPDMYHNQAQATAAWDNGSMDNFYLHENATCLPCGTIEPFGHYNGSTVPLYWDMAQEFVLNDHFYSSLLDYSLPNHWHIVAGQAPAISVTYNPDNSNILNNPKAPVSTIVSEDHTYLNQSNGTRSIEDLLLNSSVSWTYYDSTLGNYSKAIQVRLNANGTIGSVGQAYSLWNAQAAKAESYNASFTHHFKANTNFFDDAASGTLPAVSWVIPGGQESDHPPTNSTAAQTWLASVVDATEKSPEWNSTALFVTWDDYGGFWDNMAPPTWQGQQLGMRVPLLIISPWVDAGYVDHSSGFFESVLHLVEWRFGLGCLTALDCTAPLPIHAFDWNRSAPHAPIYFPTNITAATYPYVHTGWPAGPFRVPESVLAPTGGNQPDVD